MFQIIGGDKKRRRELTKRLQNVLKLRFLPMYKSNVFGLSNTHFIFYDPSL